MKNWVQEIGRIEGSFSFTVVEIGIDSEEEEDGVPDDYADDHAFEVGSVK